MTPPSTILTHNRERSSALAWGSLGLLAVSQLGLLIWLLAAKSPEEKETAATPREVPPLPGLARRYGKGLWVFSRAILSQARELREQRARNAANPKSSAPPTIVSTPRGPAILEGPERLDAAEVPNVITLWLENMAERLMDDLGYLADPADRLGMLDGQSMRAARVIVDIGMHLELEIPRDNPFGFHPGETWTPDLGLEFMRQHCLMDDAFIRFEVARYLGWPGQAPSYKVGERIWLQAREDAKARKGADFDLKEFHSAALDLGSLGLDPLRAALARI